MKSRSAVHLIGVVTLLTALSLALTVVVFAEADPLELDYPDGGADLTIVPEASKAAPEADLAFARVTIDLQPIGRLQAPVGGPQLTCRLERDPSGEATVPFGFVAGTAALPAGMVPQRALRGRHLVRVDLERGLEKHPSWRLVDLDDLGRGELWIGPPLLVHGLVVDEEQQPIAEARIWVSGMSTVTDPEGRFSLPAVDGGDGVILVATAEGRATTMRRFTLAPGAGSEHRIVMERGAELRVQHAARQGVGPPGRAYVIPAHVLQAGAGLSTAVLDTPFWWPLISGEGELDAQGSVLLRGLPMHASLLVFVHQPESPSAAAVPVVTKAGPQRVLVQGAEAPVLTGRVVDQAGAPLPDALVFSGESAPLPADRFALPVEAILLDARVCRTDAEGRFRVAQRRIDRSRITVARVGHMALEVEVRAANGQLVRPLMLPHETESSAHPALLLRLAEQDQALKVRVTQGGNTIQGYQSWRAVDPFRISFRESALVDVVITTDPDDGQEPSVRQFQNIAVSGPVELD